MQDQEGLEEAVQVIMVIVIKMVLLVLLIQDLAVEVEPEVVQVMVVMEVVV